MKKLLVVSLVVFVFIVSLGVANAVNKSNTGCGLGYLLFKDSGNSTFINILAVTTNHAVSFNQSFGITTGTLECSQPKKIVFNERLNEFVASNMDAIAQEIAAGDGESLDTLAELMEVPSAKRADFFSLLQQNFSEIFTSKDIQSAQVIENIVNITT